MIGIRNSVVWAIVLLVAFSALPGRAIAQPGRVGTDRRHIAEDQRHLMRDESQLSRDIANGNLAGAISDISRIGQDRRDLRNDVSRLRSDLYERPTWPNNNWGTPGMTQQAGGLIPHPSYPGYYYYAANPGQLYTIPGQTQTQTTVATEQLVPSAANPGYFYYPSNPGQLYYYPGQTPPAQTQVVTAPPASNPAPSNPSPAGAAVSNPTPIADPVLILNPAKNRVTLQFAVDGTAYSTPNGFLQRFDSKASYTISFDRGGALGQANYTLAPGKYEFVYGESTGWDLKKVAQSTSLASNPLPIPVDLSGEEIRRAGVDSNDLGSQSNLLRETSAIGPVPRQPPPR